jgi:hypothetical protein
MRAPDGFDPNAPFISPEDGLEYEDFAAKILGQPRDCWRNAEIIALRKNGQDEASIRRWIAFFDGPDPTPTSAAPCSDVVRRIYSATRAADFCSL